VVQTRLFEEAWKFYPRKLGKQKALRAFLARLRAKTPPDQLLQATRNYAKACRDKEPQFVMHGSTFYGPDEPWRDYLNGDPDKAARRQREYVPEYLR
jgi:hypothetical protein